MGTSAGRAALLNMVICCGEGGSLHVKPQHPSVTRWISSAPLELQMLTKSECFCGRIYQHWTWEGKLLLVQSCLKNRHVCINICIFVCFPGG